MLKSYKYRIYPNKEQENLLNKHFGACRFVYNFALGEKIKAYETQKKSLSRFDLQVIIKDMKKTNEYSWLREINSQSVQAVLRNLESAFTKFFREKKGFPNFKSKKDNHKSFQCPQSVKVNFETNRITIPKINDIKIKLHRKFEGDVKTVTVSKNPSNKYFASILVESEDIKQVKPKIIEGTSIGVDLGLIDYIVISDGRRVNNPKHLKNSLKRLKVLQKRLSKKQNGSSNRNKARLKVARMHEKIQNQRSDFIHKLTYNLTHDSQVDTIITETLNVKGMIKNHCLAQSIGDVGWSLFDNQLMYKCGWYNKNHLKIGMFEASSKICNVCGCRNNNLTLKDRTCVCENCNTLHDRDGNSSLNIKKFGLQNQNLISGSVRPGELVESPALAGALKQEAHCESWG